MVKIGEALAGWAALYFPSGKVVFLELCIFPDLYDLRGQIMGEKRTISAIAGTAHRCNLRDQTNGH